MNEGQNKFFEFIMACAKEECRDKAKALLAESFERQSSGRFGLPFLAKFNAEIKGYIRDDKLDEVIVPISTFPVTGTYLNPSQPWQLEQSLEQPLQIFSDL